MARQWMTTREAAEAGVVVGADTERKVRDLCASGRLGHHLVGRTYYITADQASAFNRTTRQPVRSTR